jgi:20S proteasome alpha/beta subunit
MTIVLGMRCDGGAIIAADTLIVDSSGATSHAYKIIHFTGKDSTFAIGNASNDANASTTMVRKIQAALQNTKFKNWNDLENVIAYEMSEFSQPFTSPPQHQLVIAAFVRNLGIELYFCEPPKTVVAKTMEGYVAAGSGYAFTDPLRHTLFEFTNHLSPQLVLRQVAYLMYRAKKDCASFCGGDTAAFYICIDGRAPEMVRLDDLKKAEKSMHQLDVILSTSAHAALGYPTLSPENVGLSIEQSKMLRDVVFYNLKVEPIQAPVMPQHP